MSTPEKLIEAAMDESSQRKVDILEMFVEAAELGHEQFEDLSILTHNEFVVEEIV